MLDSNLKLHRLFMRRESQHSSEESSEEKKMKVRVFVNLVTYIESSVEKINIFL